MSHERPAPSPRPGPGTEFGFTEREQLFDRVSHDRLISFLDDETTAVHRVQESSNSYGEFLFVTVSRPGATQNPCVTFFGLGYHEHRERWVIDEWYWYHANVFSDTFEQRIPNQEAKTLIQRRLEEVRPDSVQPVQSARGRLFEMLADLTDEDGALAEIEDLGDIADFMDSETG